MKTRVIYFDLLRIYLCIAILLYHMGLLKGGYLAVCSFFVLSGYLSVQSLKRENFSILAYYKSRLLRVYAPMLFVVFVSLALCMVLLPDLVWVSMKQEITSILFCYNNSWQISANMDYFARHIDSPYMHLWYVAILLQLELIFPLIYAVLKFFKEIKVKIVPMVLCWTAVICSIVYFVFMHLSDGLMPAYYNTLTRSFSWLAGIAVGFWHISGKPLVMKKVQGKPAAKILLCILIVAQTVLFVMASAESKLYLGGMIATTFIMCRMLEYAKTVNDKIPDKIKKLIVYFSGISYEIFLVQYPVIFILESLDLSTGFKYLLIVITTVAAAAVLNLMLHPPKNPLPVKVVVYAMLFALMLGVGYGDYRYVIAPDLKAEQERLAEEMKELEIEQRKKQIEYETKLHDEELQRRREEQERIDNIEAEQSDIDSQIAALDEQILAIEETVVELSITFIGDSVLLGASDVLYQNFINCYIDAEIGRTAYTIDPILQDLKSRGILGEVVVINCGANGDCSEEFKDLIMETLWDRQVFWVTTTNNKRANESIIEYAKGHDNLHVIDWGTISEGHGEYFAGDGIHLGAAGREAYYQAVLDAICDYYVEELEAQKSELNARKQELEEEKTQTN